MNNTPIPFSTLASLQTVHLFGSAACNLECPYCSQIDQRTAIRGNDYFADSSFLERIEGWRQTHFYVSGGEPLFHEGLPDFLRVVRTAGHIVSFDTNAVVPLKKLEELLNELPINSWGFFNISHHLLAGVSFPYILERAMLLQQYGIRHFVKYIGVPENIEDIRRYSEKLDERGVGWAVTVFQTFKTAWKGRHFPNDYTVDELDLLLGMTTFLSHALQFFGGVRISGLRCRGGSSFLTCNMPGTKGFTPCCHRTDIVDGESLDYREQSPPSLCTNSECLGDIMMILGINGIAGEIQTLEDICNGQCRPVGVERAIDFCKRIDEKYPLVNRNLFERFLDRQKTDCCQMFSFNSSNLVSDALYHQKESVSKFKSAIESCMEIVDQPNDLTPYQWVQYLALGLHFKPDVVIEVGRGRGASTTLFGLLSWMLGESEYSVHSVCRSREWEKRVLPKIIEKGLGEWQSRVRLYNTSLKDFLKSGHFPAGSRYLVFWREPGFETARYLLGGLLPKLERVEHLVLFHGSTDARYQGMPERFSYNYWEPNSGVKGGQLQLGEIISAQPQIIPITDFTCRNDLTIFSAEHDLRTGILSDQKEKDRLVKLWDTNLVSQQAHWHWFSLNEKRGPYQYPDTENS